MNSNRFYLIMLALIVLGYLATALIDNQYPFFAGFAILQLVIMALAWNILGGYGGYVNFGSAAFFGLGAYSAIFSYQFFGAPLIVQVLAGGFFCALLGLATGYLTLRLRGVYFAIATLALLVVSETLIHNWDYVGGAAGAYLLPDRTLDFLGVLIVGKDGGLFSNNKEFLFFCQCILVLVT
ncbi:MAG TPA: branched-chain amino acid ABC transporter permease, partial [Rhodospirillales bacterium]|nr:branched-chain amino acid ABC transporter permease [Rhodospirillales bacterium]